MTKGKRYGVCKLTGKTGHFVKSHIIPKAFTRPAYPGGPLIQGGAGVKALVRRDSWYDLHLVTSDGEEILRDIDTWAIEELRKTKMVWSGWGQDSRFSELITHPFSENSGVRMVEFSDINKMRKFFLSLLWRAAASDLHEMSFVSLPQHDINILREYIAFDKILAKNFYPVELFQLSTVGEIHNHTPIMKTKAVPSGIEGVFSPVDFVRFYFDGLIAHIRVGATALDHVERFGPLFLGQQKETGVVTISYETSLQRDTLEFLRNKTVFYPTP